MPMAALRTCLEECGFSAVTTFIASGNVILTSEHDAAATAARIEAALPAAFDLDSDLVRVLVLSGDQLRAVVRDRPAGFGDQPDVYHSDAIFLIGVGAAEVMPLFKPREGVDRVWPGDGVVYSQRLSAQRTKSRLSAIIASPLYQSMTIRSWKTTVTLADMLTARDGLA